MGKIRGLALAWALAATGGAMAAVVGEATLTKTFGTTDVADCPTRIVVAGDLVFALETGASRIAVHDKTTGAAMRYYGATNMNSGVGVNYTDSSAARKRYGNNVVWTQSSGDGGFANPAGLALDTFGGANRLAVADAGNGRVQVFTFADGTGEITFESSYAGSGADALIEPSAVAFMDGGDLLVADRGTPRLVRLNYAGGAWSQVAAYDFADGDEITGVCYDKDTEDGFWVALAQGQAQCVSFHHFSDFNAQQPVVALGTPFTVGAFNYPMDVQAWEVDGRKFVVVADYSNSRVRVLHPATSASGGYKRLSVAADVGNDARTDNNNEELFHPGGVFPVQGEATLYVADTGHRQVKRYGMAFEEVEDPDEIGPPVGWDISSFELVDNGATARVGWKVPSEGDGRAPEGEDFKFLLLFNASLADIAQEDGATFLPEDANYTVGSSEEGGATHTEDFPLDGAGQPSSGFFRLWWLNKVAE